MKNVFNSISVKAPNYSKFDLSHEAKLSCKMGDLVPILCQEVVPGDKFSLGAEIFMRMAPMVAPVMHRVNVFTHFFFVPNRIIYTSWEDFITGGEDGLQAPAFPKITMATGNKAEFAKGKLADYMGIPDVSGQVTTYAHEISALPFRAYQEIYNEFYRDQNLTAPIAFNHGTTLDAGDDLRLLALRKRAWEKDYFTSALPWAQRGGAAAAPINVAYTASSLIKTSAGANVTGAVTGAAGTLQGNAVNSRIENISSASMDINALRQAVKLQEWLERNARGGSRYIEQIWAHFHVKSSDGRLDRPEYLGGGKSPMVISEVLNTTGTTGQLPQGNMSGHGLSVQNSNGFTKSFEEHGWIIGIMSVLPKTAYQQGLDKVWRKFDKLEYLQPEFANLGEQAIKNQEIYLDMAAPSADGTFGYQSRYAEYKYKASRVHGDFKTTLEAWHMGRKFTAMPALNTAFIESDPTTRIYAVVDTSDKLYCQIYFNMSAVRALPYFNTPSLL